MKVIISKDEWWPVYTLEADLQSYGRQIEIPKELYESYEKSYKEFNDIQSELRKLYVD